MRYNIDGGSMKKRKVKIKYKNVFLFFFLTILLTIFLFFFLITVFYMREKNDMTKILTDLSLIDCVYHRKNDQFSTYVRPPENMEDSYYNYIMKDFIEVDLSPLTSKNRDTKGYIQIEGTSFSYPFVLEKEKGYYQNHSYYNKENAAGWLYIKEDSTLDSFQNTVLYADGKDGDEVFSLKPLLEKGWSKENYLVKISTAKTNSLWKPFSIYIASTTNNLLEEPYLLSKRSLSSFATTVSKEDIILTIITRHHKNQLLIMHAKLVKKMKR